MSEEQYHSASHCKYLIQYHIIWCPKFRFSVLYSDWNLDSGNYARTSTSDYFAECFRDYYFSANSRSKLKANCPKSYSFIQKTINKF